MSRSEALSGVARHSIVHLVDSSAIGGIERHIETLASAQFDEGYEAGVLLLRDHGRNPWVAQLQRAQLPYAHLNGGFAQLLIALAADKPAVLHTHGYKAGILGRLVCSLIGAPVVSTFHAGERGPFPVNLCQWVDDITSFLGKRIAVSDGISRSLLFQCRTIPNFIQVPDRPVVQCTSRVAAFVGRLSHEKGPDLFCELALRHQGVCDFRIYGDGPMRRELEKEYGAFVEFCGLQTDMARVWPQIGLLVMPSRAEGLPMAALEALATGVPILASSVGGLPDVVIPDETGWLAASGDVSRFCEHLLSWVELKPERRAEFSENAHRLAQKKFGAEQGLSRVLSTYRSAGWVG